MKKSVCYAKVTIDNTSSTTMIDDIDTLVEYVHEHPEIDRVYLYEQDAELIKTLLFINPTIEIAILNLPVVNKIIRCKNQTT